MLSFDIIYGSDNNGGENPEDGEEVVLEFSQDGVTWQEMDRYSLNVTSWTTQQVSVPGSEDVDQLEGDAGITEFSFTVVRQSGSNFAGAIDWEITGSGDSPANANDFAGGAFPAGTLSFNAGEIQKSVTIEVVGDSTFEADETFDFVLIGTGTMETATIINDDMIPDGDFDGDGAYTCSDVDPLVLAIAGQTGELQYDLSGDGLLTIDDLDLWLATAGAVNLHPMPRT